LFYRCVDCGDRVDDSYPKRTVCVGIVCMECAFKRGIISEKVFLESHGIFIDSIHAAVSPTGNIVVWSGSKLPPWDEGSDKSRNIPGYNEWRAKVFERDEFTCQNCEQVGGVLNAHHIKPYAEYPDLRTEVPNGITLCEECHREVHSCKR